MKPIVDFIHTRHIDSFPKLFFLLFLCQHPNFQATSQEFGTRLYLGSTELTDSILLDLQQAGLVDQIEDGYRLHNGLAASPDLKQLTQAFEDPLTRQQLFDAVKHH